MFYKKLVLSLINVEDNDIISTPSFLYWNIRFIRLLLNSESSVFIKISMYNEILLFIYASGRVFFTFYNCLNVKYGLCYLWRWLLFLVLKLKLLNYLFVNCCKILVNTVLNSFKLSRLNLPKQNKKKTRTITSIR